MFKYVIVYLSHLSYTQQCLILAISVKNFICILSSPEYVESFDNEKSVTLNPVILNNSVYECHLAV